MMKSWMRKPPFEHQALIFSQTKNKRAHGFCWEQGTGKTKAALDKAAHLFFAGKIKALVVLAPNGVHRNWIETEIPDHLQFILYNAVAWQPNWTKEFQRRLKGAFAAAEKLNQLLILAINIEALQRHNSKAERVAMHVLKKLPTYLVCDESSQIKTPTAARTRAALRLARVAECRSILTGTPVTQGPLDYFSQCEFLKRGALGFTSYVAFKSYFADWNETPLPGNPLDHRGQPKVYKTVKRYKNLDVLAERVGALCSIIRKEDCLDLPSKVFIQRQCVMTPRMAQLYAQVKQEVLIWIEEHRTLTITHLLPRLLRLLQLTGGFIATDQEQVASPIEGSNPKLESLLDLINDLGPEEKVIVWARFLPELRLISEVLGDNYGGKSVSRWWGSISTDERMTGMRAFQEDKERRFFVGQQHSGGYGITLTAASHVVYFSNDFSLEARLQSEDRAHRIGQNKSVTYSDLVMQGTIDERVLSVLRSKRNMADQFKTAEEVARWLK